ncbi:DUF3180 domain-containing protein [Actinoplanes sp. N902-109]|uniref:DUF3180 domain-containing protein n=1 Tax=Actinoplanes sp. (strain N902-109) TaxID=649831 RepID=UPI000683EEDD|nr:DUF3180 domain-containing protein [Actinoplanes sp. N902-109]
MRPTSLSALVVAALAAAAVGWLLLSALYYNTGLRLPWTPIFVFAALAIAEAVLAQNTSARIQHKPGAGRINPLAVARYVVLAKASSLAGALFAGFSAGLLAWLALEPTEAAHDDVPAGIGGVVAALALVGAALWLERACRVPKEPDRKGGDDSDRHGSRA